MSKLQQKFAEILIEKKRVIGVNMASVQRWKKGTNSPSLHLFEQLCKENEIEPPFFFDGKIESLVEYNKTIGEKMGFKIQIIFEA